MIWERTIDWDLQAKRRRQFVRFFVAPAFLAMLIALVAGGVWEMLGVLIVALLFGLLVRAWIELRNLNRRRFRTLRVIDGELALEHSAGCRQSPPDQEGDDEGSDGHDTGLPVDDRQADFLLTLL